MRDRAFLARQLIFELSLARSNDLLDLEDLHWLSDFLAILSDYSEDRHGNVVLLEALFHSLLHLPVKEPLVDLYPREACHLHGPLALLTIKLAACFVEQVFQVVNLQGAFAQAIFGEDRAASVLHA